MNIMCKPENNEPSENLSNICRQDYPRRRLQQHQRVVVVVLPLLTGGRRPVDSHGHDADTEGAARLPGMRAEFSGGAARRNVDHRDQISTPLLSPHSQSRGESHLAGKANARQGAGAINDIPGE